MSKNSKVFEQFKKGNWEKLSQQERLNAYQQLENMEAKLKNRIPYVIVRQMPFFTGKWDGECCDNKQEIHIDKIFLEQDDLRFQGMSTMFHEGRHAFQHFAVNNPKYSTSKEVKDWKFNFEGYIKGTKQLHIFYAMQPLEVDARLYTLKKMKNLMHTFKQEPLFYKELKNLEETHQNYEQDAIKLIGNDYKFMITAEIRRNIYLQKIDKLD